MLDKYNFCEPVPQNDGGSRHWLQSAPRNNNGTALATAILRVQLPRAQVFGHLLRAMYGKTMADPAAIGDLAVRQVLACLQRAKKSWEEYHRVNLFSEWPYRSLQGPLSRLHVLASLIIHLRDDATACWEHLWRVREQALEKGYIAEQVNEAVLYALSTRGWPACKMWSAYLALSRLYDLHQSRAPYDPTKQIFGGGQMQKWACAWSVETCLRQRGNPPPKHCWTSSMEAAWGSEATGTCAPWNTCFASMFVGMAPQRV